MSIEVQDHAVIVDMRYYIDQLLLQLPPALMQCNTPAIKECFQAKPTDSLLLNADGQKPFHAIVVKLLYLAKRAHPDILMVTSFLCTRVKLLTKLDQKRLLRVLGYLKTTIGLKYNITPKEPLAIVAYLDATFATHEDSTLHSGVAIFVVGILVYASSRKQHCVTKSPTESELVALTDNIGIIELFDKFITFLVNDKIPTPVIYQDSSSVVSLVTQGGGITRTRHLRKSNASSQGGSRSLEGTEFKWFIQGLIIFHEQKTTGEY
jgi:hypothetical protein